MLSDVSGSFSEMANMKTEKASSTVMPSAIFSPESGGRQNTSNVSTDIIMHGLREKSVRVEILALQIECTAFVVRSSTVLYYSSQVALTARRCTCSIVSFGV